MGVPADRDRPPGARDAGGWYTRLELAAPRGDTFALQRLPAQARAHVPRPDNLLLQ